MTYNQIVAADNRERVRSNQVNEAETERHNKASEALAYEANEITRTHNTEMYSLQQDYNNRYLEYLNAAEEDKVALESQLNWIKEQQMQADQRYKVEMSMIEGKKANIEEMYKTGLLELQSENNDIAYKRAYYEGQKTEADIQYINNQIDLAWKKFNQEQQRLDREYELGIINATTRQQELKRAQNALDFEIEKYKDTGSDLIKSQTTANKARATRDYGGVATDAVNAGAHLFDSIAPF